MRFRRSIFWIFAAAVAFVPPARAQLEDELLFGIEHALLPELLPAEGLSVAFPRTIGNTRIFIDLRNRTNQLMEGPLTFTIEIASGPWIWGPWTNPVPFDCSGNNKKQTCFTPFFQLPPGDAIRIDAPIICPTFSNDLTRIRIFGPEIPTGELTIKQHNSPIVAVAGYVERILEGTRATFTEKVSLKNIGPSFTGKANTLFSLSEGVDTVINPPSGVFWGGVAPCPPGAVQICPTGPITFGEQQTFALEYRVGTTIGSKPMTSQFSMSFPDNPTVPGFNLSHLVKTPLAGPDPVPMTHFAAAQSRDVRVGQRHFYFLKVKNEGFYKTEGPITALVTLSGGLTSPPPPTGWTFHEELLPGEVTSAIPGNVSMVQPGMQRVTVTIEGGGDIHPGNNIQTFDFEVHPVLPDSLERSAEEVARILSGR